MSVFQLQDSIYEVGAKHPERRIFDCLVYMPQGTTYNSYYIKGQTHSALIDCVDPEKIEVLLANMKEIPEARIDYLILLHSEQDHSGSVYNVLSAYPKAKIVCTEKVKTLMAVHMHLSDERMLVMKEDDMLDLGGMSLTFYPIPFAHWPDNTMVRLMPQNILFSSDLFGAHYTEKETAKDPEAALAKNAKGYFAEIMMPFRRTIAKYVEKVAAMDPAVIAPSHGAIWLTPQAVLDLYREWTGDEVRKSVTLPFLSMHDSTRHAAELLAKRLRERGIEVQMHDLCKNPQSLLIETGEMIFDLVDASAVVFALPTVLGGPHPAAVYAATVANAMMPKTKTIGFLCSFGWATKAAETMNALTANFKGKRLEALLFKGLPTEEDELKIRAYADEIADAVLM